MKKLIFTMGFTALMSGAAMNAQVTIGKDKSPEPFSVLELISNDTRGLRLPQLTQKERNALVLTFAGHETEALGLQIFNTSTKCVETWNGVEWIQACDGVAPLIITPPPHYNLTCTTNNNCIALQDFAVTPLADVDLVFDETTNSNGVLTVASGAACKMKPVTGGVFYMGNQASESTKPNYGISGDIYTYSVHQAGVSSFYMGETEVTQGLYKAVMVDFGGTQPSTTYGISDNHPAYYVNWFDAAIFCNKLSILVGRTPCYSIGGTSSVTAAELAALTYDDGAIPTSTGHTNYSYWNTNFVCDFTANGFRLSTEAEWEYAARGGQKNDYTRTLGGVGTTQYLYSGSNTASDVAAYSDANLGSDKGGNNSSSIWVKQLQPNELGLYDMSGNVYEWCWDWYADPYTSCCDESNPKGPATGTYRIQRSCSWFYPAPNCRVSTRSCNYPYFRNYYCGFRVVCK
jgi:formylglycine-generating enzyme required for sulfatase activity